MHFDVMRGKDEGGGGRCGGGVDDGVCVYCTLSSGCLNLLVALMNFETALAISGIPSSISIAIGLRIFLACCARAHLL